MQKFKNFIIKLSGVFAALALLVGISTSNTACFSTFHQPKEPATMNKFKF